MVGSIAPRKPVIFNYCLQSPELDGSIGTRAFLAEPLPLLFLLADLLALLASPCSLSCTLYLIFIFCILLIVEILQAIPFPSLLWTSKSFLLHWKCAEFQFNFNELLLGESFPF